MINILIFYDVFFILAPIALLTSNLGNPCVICPYSAGGL